MGKIDPFEVVKWGALIIGGSMAFKAMQKFGLVPSTASTANDAIEGKAYILPNFWKKPPPTGYNTPLFTSAYVNQIINNIWDSTGTFNDCEACIVGELKKIQYKTQYSFLADKFLQQKKRDLTAFLKGYFNADELLPIWAYLDSLPTYKKI